ncbi:MAG: threonine--tRNA ligase [Dehalococcoidia bacterium]|nr:MAG: threonine--tRNA ligase [Dehalococcoidia bacterium]
MKTDMQKNDSSLEAMRHSASHIMAQAVLSCFPDARMGIGPAIENGFYYDFELPRALTPEDLPVIADIMKSIIAKNLPFTREEVSKAEARLVMACQPYKLELLDDIPDEIVSLYRQGAFVDLCRGPHVASTGDVKAFKLTSIAGAYWRGDEKRPMLQRIYGAAFATQKELDDYLKQQEEAAKRDHRKLGRELEIFIFDDEIGPGLPLWLPNGGAMIEELEKLAKDVELKHGYVRVKTPHITKETLFQRSGHLPYYAESMYPPMELEGVRYYIKPMNCPMHHKIFASKPRSYRDLPLRLAEYGTCYRYEKSGELFGLMRVRSMQMNDAHIYCSEKQFEQEFMAVIDLYLGYFKVFDISDYVMRLSTHSIDGLGKKYVDNPSLWLKTEDMVRTAMQRNNIPFVEIPDEAAFYGPKIDVQVKSAIGKEFTLATNQVDFAQAERFELEFTNEQGAKERPLIIHRAPLSTHERLIGFLLEHYGGAFPVWLASVQAVIIPVTDGHVEYAEKLDKELKEIGIRVKVNSRSDRMNYKIREAQLGRVPYMIIVGDKEVSGGTISVRLRNGEQKNNISFEEFKKAVIKVIVDKAKDFGL